MKLPSEHSNTSGENVGTSLSATAQSSGNTDPSYDEMNDSLSAMQLPPGDDNASDDYESDSDEQEDVVIAVMGATGSGKSSFINLLTGKTSVVIGDSLESETADVDAIRFVDGATGRKVTIVDTPGFDDSRQGVTDTDILKKIADFLLSEYDADRKLTGLIYVQRISDPRFSGQQGKNLRMFQKLCGTETYKNVVVLTTFWDQVGEEIGAKREEQLLSKFFKSIVDGGAHFMRHDRTLDSAGAVLNYVFTNLAPVTTRIQIEMGKEGKTLVDTAAGSVQQEEIERVIAQHKKEVSSLMAEMETIKESNTAARRELEEERAKLQEQLTRWETERVALQAGLDKESSARQKLEADIAAEKADRDKWREEQERKFEERGKANSDAILDKAEEKRRVEERVREEVARAVHAERHKSFRKKALDFAEDIPLVPTFLVKPTFGAVGMGLDIAKAVRNRRSKK